MNYIIDLKDEINESISQLIEREVNKAKLNNYKSITLLFNSFGGSVYDGLSIISILKNSGLETIAKIEGYCASMAAIIAMTCDKIYMAKHGILMFHNPYLEGIEEMSESEKSAMQKTANSLIMLASRRIDTLKLKKMMDKETWLDADEAKGFGLIDDIYDINLLTEFDLISDFRDAVVNKNQNLLNNIYNKIKTSMETKENLIEEIKDETCIEIEITTESDVEALAEKAMGLESEEEISLEIENPVDSEDKMDYKKLYLELLKLFEDTKNSVEILENRVVEFEKRENEANLNRAIERVNLAVNEGRIDESSKSEWVETLKNNFDLGVKMLNTIKIATKSPILPFNKTKIDEVKSNWTIRDYEEKDPKALTEILKNNKPLYKQMFYDFYGVEYKG